VELCTRAVLLLLRVHRSQLVASASLAGMLEALQASVQGHLLARKDCIGFNQVALRFMEAGLANQDTSGWQSLNKPPASEQKAKKPIKGRKQTQNLTLF
jgi:hypothetical protein